MMVKILHKKNFHMCTVLFYERLMSVKHFQSLLVILIFILYSVTFVSEIQVEAESRKYEYS